MEERLWLSCLRSWGTQSFLGVDSPHLHIHEHLHLKQKLVRQRVQEGILDKRIHVLTFITCEAVL